MKNALATEKIDFGALGREIMAGMQGQPGSSDFDSVSPTARMFAAAENARDQFDLPEDINPSVIAFATLSPKYIGSLRMEQLRWRAQQDRDWVAQTATAAESPLTPPQNAQPT